jgi:hypothetical protein
MLCCKISYTLFRIGKYFEKWNIFLVRKFWNSKRIWFNNTLKDQSKRIISLYQHLKILFPPCKATFFLLMLTEISQKIYTYCTCYHLYGIQYRWADFWLTLHFFQKEYCKDRCNTIPKYGKYIYFLICFWTTGLKRRGGHGFLGHALYMRSKHLFRNVGSTLGIKRLFYLQNFMQIPKI